MGALYSECAVDDINQYPSPEVHEFSRIARLIYECNSRHELAKSDLGGEIVDGIMDIMDACGASILSLDVFDTFLLRNNKPEAVRYLEMSEKAAREIRRRFPDDRKLHALTAEDVCEARIAGMRATYRTRPLVQGCGEGHIDEVHAMQCHMLGLPEEARDVLLDVEVRYEAANLRLNPIFEKLSRRVMKNGGSVILVSDMYLPAEVIERIIRILTRKKLYSHLFSSADLVISKRSGKIFPHLEKHLNTDGKKFLHIGDSWQGDVARPRGAGWHAMYFPISRKELMRRMESLREFMAMMDEKGIDTRSWAKL